MKMGIFHCCSLPSPSLFLPIAFLARWRKRVRDKEFMRCSVPPPRLDGCLGRESIHLRLLSQRRTPWVWKKQWWGRGEGGGMSRSEETWENEGKK